MKAAKLFRGILLSRLGRKTPLVVINKVTFRCNLSCKYCGYWKTPRKDMSTEQCKKAISEFADAGCVYWEFTGGEPTIRNDIGELIQHAKERGLMVSVATNGLLIKKRLDALKRADFIHISFDGSKEVHEMMRGKGTHKRALDAIRYAHENGVMVYPETVISKMNIENNCESLRKAIEFSNSINRRLTITFPYKDEYNKANVDEVMPSKEQMRQATKFLNEEERRGVINLKRPYLDWIEAYTWGKDEIDCWGGKLFCELFPDGKVSTCLFREDESIEGLKYGFVNAFKMLKPKRCGCTVGYMEYNLLFSLNPKAIIDRLEIGKKLFKK